MFQGIFKSAINDANKNYIFGTGSIPIQIKSAQLATFADGTTKQQGYQVAEVNKLISTMLTGWDANGNKPKSMSNNYLELILSCDNGFVVKKRLQFPHIIAWQNDSTPYNIANVYKEFSIDNWLKADDFENPDITLVVEPTDEILTTSTATPPKATTEEAGRFYLYYRNLPVGVNRVHIDFHIKTKTEPIDFDLEVIDGLSWKDAQTILASNEQAKINVLLSGVKDVYKFTGAEGNFEDITMYQWSELYKQIISLNPSNKFTHDLYFVLIESQIQYSFAPLYDKKIVCFGDSTAEYTDYDGKRYSDYIAEITGANVINVGIGGTRIEKRADVVDNPSNQNEAYAALDLMSLIDAVVEHNFTYQFTALNSGFISKTIYLPIIKRLSEIDFNTVDVVTILAGTNSWRTSRVLGTTGQTDSELYMLSAINLIIKKLLQAYPHIKIYWFTPIVRWIDDNGYTESSWCDNFVLKGYIPGDLSLTLAQYKDYIKNEVINNHIPVCDLYNELGINKFNFWNYFPNQSEGDIETDGTHPRKGMNVIGRKIASFITSNLLIPY